MAFAPFRFNITAQGCELPPAFVVSDSTVAGAGTILGFIITAGIALSLATVVVISDLSGQRSSQRIALELLNGLSDQHILEGIGVQVLGLANLGSITPYHFYITWMLALLSMATNFSALLAGAGGEKPDWIMRALRQFFMLVNVALSVVYGVLLLQANLNQLAPTLPIACIWQPHATDPGAQGNTTIATLGTAAVICASVVIFLLGAWVMNSPSPGANLLRASSLVVMGGIGAGAAARAVMLSPAFGNPSTLFIDLASQYWTFGQILTLMLMILPMFQAIESFRAGPKKVGLGEVNGKMVLVGKDKEGDSEA